MYAFLKNNIKEAQIPQSVESLHVHAFEPTTEVTRI
jgi:hypothetical protein